MNTLLMIDDDHALCRSLEIQLKGHGHALHTAGTLTEGAERLASLKPNLVLLDLHLPDGNGLQALPDLLERYPDLPIVMVTGHQDMDATMQAMRQGAFDYIRKPFDLDDILLTIEKSRRAGDTKSSRVQAAVVDESAPRYEIIGAHRSIMEIVKQLGLLSKSRVTVLITGESGTGKELVAKALHRAGAADKPYVAVNCSAVVPTLFESELFGHEQGAFTGADARRIGKFEHAADGTVFLDEVGDMPLEQQAKLLRVLQEQEFERVGGLKRIPFQARVVAATNRDLQRMVREGAFREDLYFRLSVSPIPVPPLRERRSDIRLLVKHLVGRIARELHKPVSGVDEPALRRLESYDWPGNVRELENVLTRAVALAQGDIITLDGVSSQVDVGSAVVSEDQIFTLREAEKRHVEKALLATGWHMGRTAETLDISPTTLRKKIADYGLKQPL